MEDVNLCSLPSRKYNLAGYMRPTGCAVETHVIRHSVCRVSALLCFQRPTEYIYRTECVAADHGGRAV